MGDFLCITKSIKNLVDEEIQLFLWKIFKKVNIKERDYLQIFELQKQDDTIHIIHRQEIPSYEKEYVLKGDYLLNDYYNCGNSTKVKCKIYIIIEEDYALMLFSEEY